MKTYEEINERIERKKAVVMTAEEIIGYVELKGVAAAAREVDVVTTATFGPMCSLESLCEVAAQVGRLLKQGALACVESTVAPGTTTNVVQPILKRKSEMAAGRDFHLAFS
jgi:uncharacterized protein (DUF39 family)